MRTPRCILFSLFRSERYVHSTKVMYYMDNTQPRPQGFFSPRRLNGKMLWERGWSYTHHLTQYNVILFLIYRVWMHYVNLSTISA